MVGVANGASHPNPAGKPRPQKCSRFDTEGFVGPSGALDGSLLAVSILPRGPLRSACHRSYFSGPFHRPQLAAFWPQWAHLGPLSPGAGRLVRWGLGSGVSDLVQPPSLPPPGWGRAPCGRTGHCGPLPLADPGRPVRPTPSLSSSFPHSSLLSPPTGRARASRACPWSVFHPPLRGFHASRLSPDRS